MKQRSSTSSFKTSYLGRFAVFFLLVAVMLAAAQAAVLALERVTNDRTSTQKISQYQIEDLLESDYDPTVLVMGSSHAMCTYDPAVIENLGTQSAMTAPMRAYNLGTALQQPDTAYHLLREVYKTKSPKVLIYDVYFKVLQPEKSNQQAETVLMELPFSANAVKMWWSCLDTDGRVSFINHRVNPFGRLFSIFSDWSAARAAVDEARNPNYRGKGFYVTEGVVSEELLKAENHPFSSEFQPFSERQISYLKKLAALAESHGTRVIFLSAPMPPTVLGRVEYYPEINARVTDLAAELGVPFYDFAMDQLSGELALEDADFADQGHLNLKGAEKFGRYFADVMRKWRP